MPVCIFMHLNELDDGVKKRRFKKCAPVPNLDNQEDGGKGVQII